MIPRKELHTDVLVLGSGPAGFAAAYTAAKNGAKLDGWDEYFDYGAWLDAFEKCGVDPNFYTIRGYGEDEILSWDTIDVGVTKKFLLRERRQAYEANLTDYETSAVKTNIWSTAFPPLYRIISMTGVLFIL